MKNALNSQQKEASEATPGPLLIVAGAGTGKTRTLVSRLLHFIEGGVPPHRICAITFTNKAAREMADRVEQSAKYSGRNNSPFIGTFHSLGAKILRKESHPLKRTPNFVIFDDHDSFELIKKIAKQLFPKEKIKEGGVLPKKAEWETPAYLARKISELKNKGGVFEEMRGSESAKDRLALEAFERYEAALARNNAFDFDDLIDKVAQLFKNHPAALARWRGKFDAVLVDEYQDLNPKQYEFVRFLAGGHKNLSVVGDDEQLIYGWRYADLKTFLDFEKDWPGARVAFLEENYRSSGNIIQAASALAKNNLYRVPKNLWTKNPAGSLIKIFEASDENAEAEWVAGQIESGIMNNELSGEGNGKSIIPSTAILYRTNAQSRAIEQALIRNQIPYKIFGGLKFYERKEIKDVVAALRYAVNKKDEVSRDRLEKLLPKKKFSELAEKIGGVAVPKMAPPELVGLFLKTTGYLEYLERNFINYDERRENVAELVNFATRFDDPIQFLEEISLLQATDELANRKAPASSAKRTGQNANLLAAGEPQFAVNLMTIHLAKGLEFDNVFLAGASE